MAAVLALVESDIRLSTTAVQLVLDWFSVEGASHMPSDDDDDPFVTAAFQTIYPRYSGVIS